MQPHVRRFVERVDHVHDLPRVRRHPAHRRRPGPRRSTGKNIADLCAMQISDLADWVRRLDEPSVAPLLTGLQHLLDSFAEIGLGYLSLDRPAGTLSGGEAQRTKMIRHLGSSLTDVTYVFDEPTIGLHPHDIERMNDLLLQLRDKGNTVLVVEHKPETIAIADHVVDLGPGRGHGRRRGLLRGHRRGAAGQRHRHRSPPRRPGDAQGRGARVVRGAGGPRRDDPQPAGRRRRHPARRAVRAHRRRRLGQELADPRLGRRPRRRRGDRPGRDPRLAAQQPGDVHRPARADPQGVRQGQRREAGAVQLQLRGRLPDLQRRRRHLHRARRDGHRRVHLRGVRGQAVPGRRCWSTRSAAGTSPRCSRCRSTEAEAFFGDGEARTPAAHKVLDAARRRRARLPHASASRSPRCPAASGSGSSWPPRWPRRATSTSSTSRPPACTSPTSRTCSGLLDRLVDSGKSVIVIEHHQAVMAHADWIIDLGPGAGHDGGRIVFEGTPADLVADRKTLTGEHLAAYVGA